MNFLEYLEAGAIPASLTSLSRSFDMNAMQLGLLGGTVFLSISAGGPIAGYLLKHYDHRTILGVSVSVSS